MGNALKKQKVGAKKGSRDEKEREFWVKRLKEEAQEEQKNHLIRFLSNHSHNIIRGLIFYQKHKSSTIDITFYKPKLVLEFCECDIRTGETLRKEVFREVEAILDPEYIGSYWESLKDWLGDTEDFCRYHCG